MADTLPALRALPRLHDMPPLWDGRGVEWASWSTDAGSWSFHAPLDDRCCHECGLVDELMWTSGAVAPEPGATFLVPGSRRAKSSRELEVPAWPVYSLSATRCSGCGHTTVLDTSNNQLWELDDTDYTDAGSWPDVEALF